MAEEAKKSRRQLKDLPSADREMAVMGKCRKAIASLDDPAQRARVLAWLTHVVNSEVPAPAPKVAANQLTLDDLPGE